METHFAGDVEVAVLRNGREVDRVVRPLHKTPHGPFVRYKRRLWPVNDGSIDLNGRTLEDITAAIAAVPTPPPAHATAEPDDLRQEEVITAAPQKRMLVDAGPGTGKTYVACNRVAHLIREGVQPARIWIVSFTRTAVHEIRNRLAASLENPADAIAVRIATLDSHAWAIQSGFSGDAALTGSFNDSIENTTKQISTSEEIQDYLLERVSHLVIDEAQDIIGPRADLVTAMIDAVSEDCGVTVFADRAQAIYGFTEDSKVQSAAPKSLLGLLERRGFTSASLVNVHRTQEPGLLKIFTDVRRKVLDGSTPALKRGPAIRAEIEQLAGRDGGAAMNVSLASLDSSALVLFRRRCDVLMISNLAQDTAHRLRMSGIPARIHSWIGELLWDFTDRLITRTQFEERWQRRGKNADAAAAAWNLLLETAGETDTVVNLHRLRTVLARSNPPSLFTSPEYGDSGPILGTIHASKGREADEVHLYLPPDEDEDDGKSDLDEEIRVMFVGATRARNRLFVGRSSARGTGNYNGRVWRRAKDGGLQFEVGRAGDLDAFGLVGRGSFATAEQALAAQQRLMATPVMTKLYAYTVKELDYRMILQTDGDKQPVCVLSKFLNEELYEVTKVCGRRVQPQYLPFIRSIGLRTVAVQPDDPGLERLHDPWRGSGFMLAPMLVGFGKTKFKA